MGKLYTEALITGRFQTLHLGHQRLFDTALSLADRLTIFVGSAQECNTERNPFNVNTRIKMLRTIYDDEKRVIILPLADLSNENDITYDWGRYVLNNYRRFIHKNPDIQVYGNDESRSKWYDPKDLKNTTELIINRFSDLPISATQVRRLMVLDEREQWMALVDPKLHVLYDELRNELMSVDFYKKMYKETMESMYKQSAI